MAVLSASTMIRSISLFHMTLAALLLKNPSLIANQGVVLVLGQSMQLPHPRDFNKPSPTTAFLGVVFALLGLSDLTALSLSDTLFDEFWGNQAPVRLLFLFALTGYTYAFKPGGIFAAREAGYDVLGGGAGLNNSVVFTWGFVELAAWMWVYTTLREERTERVNKVLAERKAEEERL
ncbi:hypothetical protein ACN47E_001149 [Coniothyrium glycines]